MSKGSELEIFISLSTIIFMLLIEFIRAQNVSFKSTGTLTSIYSYEINPFQAGCHYCVCLILLFL